MHDFEQKAAEISRANELLLKGFEEYLQKQIKLPSPQSHDLTEAMRFFANEYLIHYAMQPLLQGLENFKAFVTDWLIRKCMWSDATTTKLNGRAFNLLLDFLESEGHNFSDEVKDLRAHFPSIIDLAVARANAYNDPNIDVEELFDEYGCWNDEMLLMPKKSKSKKQGNNSQPPPHQPAAGTPRLDVNIIISARAAKFLKIKPSKLVKLSEWHRDWKDPAIHWFSKWRCEDCFGMKGTKARVFLITNEASRYSFLLRLEPGDSGTLQSTVFSKMLKLLSDHGCKTPAQCCVQVQFLSGAIASLTATQNHLIYYLDCLMDRETLPYLDDYEKPLNHYLTSIEGEYRYPESAMARLLNENPPFAVPPEEPPNVIPLWN